MVQFTLPKNSKIGEGKTWPHPAAAGAAARIPRLPLEPG